jgi:calcineurin-like phosphoesterase family protein
MIFFTADTHFGHQNIIKYCKRPFIVSTQMDNTIINNFNKVVGYDDLVYHLGDIAMNRNDEYLRDVLFSLNGNIILIQGSHDKIRGNSKLAERFEKILLYTTIKIEEQRIFLSHYCHKVWDRSHYDSWHLFGHSHGSLNAYAASEGKLLDVGVDTNNFYPYSFDAVKQIMNLRPLNFNSLKRKETENETM